MSSKLRLAGRIGPVALFLLLCRWPLRGMQAAPACPADTLAFRPIQDKLTPGCIWMSPYYARIYVFSVDHPQRFHAAMQAKIYRPQLLLFQGRHPKYVSAVAVQRTASGDTYEIDVLSLGAGDYTLIATSLDPKATGDFQLTSLLGGPPPPPEPPKVKPPPPPPKPSCQPQRLPLDLNRTVPGELSADDCPLSATVQGSASSLPADVFRLDLEDAGSVDLALQAQAFDGCLALYGDKWPLAKDALVVEACAQPGAGGVKLERRDVRPGTYHLTVSTAAAGVGHYEVTSRLTCPLESMSLGQPARPIRLSQDGCLARQYSFETTQPGAFTAYLVPGQGSTANLRLLDAKGQSVEESTGAKIERKLRAGAYRLDAIGDEKGAGGPAYNFQADLRQLPEPGTTLRPGQTVEGQLSPRDEWRVDELFPLMQDRGLARLYILRVDRQQDLTIAVDKARGFTPCLWLVGGENAAQPALRACAEQGAPGVSVAWGLTAGDHLLLVKSNGSDGGSYTLRIGSPPCTPKGALTALVQGVLTAAACHDESDNAYDAYAVPFDRPHTVSVQLEAIGFRPRARLVDQNGDVLAEAVAAGGRTTAGLERLVLPGGTVAAGSADSGLGPYSIRSAWCPAESVQAGDRQLQVGDCRLTPDGPYYDQFVLSLDRPGELSIGLSSDWFDPHVILLSSDLGVLADAARSTSASIQRSVTPGLYVIRVTSSQTSIGRYNLRVDFK